MKHPVLDIIPTTGITKKEWQRVVDKTGRNYTDPYILGRQFSFDYTAAKASHD